MNNNRFNLEDSEETIFEYIYLWLLTYLLFPFFLLAELFIWIYKKIANYL